MMSIFLSRFMLKGKLLITLTHIVIIPLLKCKSEDPAYVNNYIPIAIATAHSNVLEQVLLSRLAKYTYGPQTADLTLNEHMGPKWPYLHVNSGFGKPWIYTVIRTHLCICDFLMQKNAFDRVNQWTLAKNLVDGKVPFHIVKLFILWYRKQEFMVRWSNSLSKTFRCSN